LAVRRENRAEREIPEDGMSQTVKYGGPMGIEAEFQPGSGGRVLRNLAGIYRKRDVDRAEYRALLASPTKYLQIIEPESRFSAALLCEMHKDWLGGLYVWAGKYRTVEMSKGGFRWPPAHLIESNMQRFERGLLRDNTPCAPGPLEQVALRIAKVHAELLLIHPFREGNGRLARWLAALMALQAGLPTPQFRFVGRGSTAEKARYLESVKRGYLEDFEPLAFLFGEAIERRLS
jgi:cell filamentation protein